MARLTTRTKKQPARKMKLNLFGLLCGAIALNWTQIYKVHERLGSEEFLGINPDDQPTERDKALYRKEGAYWEEQDDKSNQENSENYKIAMKLADQPSTPCAHLISAQNPPKHRLSE